ncbi:hypothetical protein ANCDUO_05009 [Ancylostoma duodenale]|uniref:Innexin n=1 Tax=Ancylostoma duodenale TaxID=51022 RepID=A0A0C2D529_9BILA|nr:hypothetical protein ANCDUO_05009 [Ancylostoma duodenale]
MLSNINNYLRQVKSTHDDDSVDRLNYVTTIYILLGFALTLFAKNYVGEPMQCWVPNQWTGMWEAFAESYCFVENTYFVPMNQSNLPAAHTREGREMIYYQVSKLSGSRMTTQEEIQIAKAFSGFPSSSR